MLKLAVVICMVRWLNWYIVRWENLSQEIVWIVIRIAIRI